MGGVSNTFTKLNNIIQLAVALVIDKICAWDCIPRLKPTLYTRWVHECEGYGEKLVAHTVTYM